MASGMQEMTQLRGYIAASGPLKSWITGARALALLTGAADSGVLNLLREPSNPAEVAAATGMTPQSVVDLCLALEAHGIVRREGEYYQLTPEFHLLTAPDAALPLPKVLRQVGIITSTLEQLAPSDTTYTTMPGEDVLAMAEAAGISATSSTPHIAPRVMADAMPEVHATWETEARHLEVGCGVGNSLLGVVLSFPKVTAVGIEIEALTASEARRRASLLGIHDRIEVRQMDASDLRDEMVFDTIQWSQYFFPTPSRQIVLSAIHRALKPGGYLFMPWIGSISDDTAPSRRAVLGLGLRVMRSRGLFLPYLMDLLGDTPARRTGERRYGALLRLIFGRWGVPVRTVAELRSEVESAGFQVLRVIHLTVSDFNFARGFLLARRGS